MATGAYSVGYNIGAKVDYSQIREANKAAGELVKNLDRIKSMQGGSSASGNMGKQYADATGESAKLERQNKDTAASQQKLNDQMKVTVDTGKGLKSVANNTRQVGDYSRSAAGDVEKLSNSAKKIKSSNTSIKQTSDNISKLGDHSQTAAKKLDRLNETGKKFKSAGYSMLPVSAALGASFLKGAKDATKLQHEYTILKNLIKTGGESTAASVKNTNKMMSDGRKYSLKYGQSQQDIAKGYEVLVRRGYTSGQALAAQKSYMQASIASGDAYSDVINNGAAAVEQFGLRSKDMATMTKNSRTALNQMAYAADLTATSFSDLGEAMKYAGPQAHSANQSLSSTASAIGMLSNYGVDGSTAGTSMRQIYQRLIRMPEKGAAADAMDTLNLSNKDFRDSKNNLLPLVDIFDKLNSRMKGMSSTQKGGIYSALFGTYGSTAGNIIGSHTKALRELNVEVAKSQKQGNGKGYIAGLSDKNMKSWQNQLKLLKSSVEYLGMSFARDVLPTVTPMVKQLNKMVQAFGKLPKPMKQTIAYGTAFIGVAGPLAVGIGSIATAASVLSKSKLLTGAAKSFLPSAVKGGTKVSKLVPEAKIVGKFGSKTKGFSYKLGSDALSASKLGSYAADAGKAVGKGSVLLKGAKAVGRRVPVLGTALAATSLIGINKKNAGSKIGDFGGNVAGMTGGAAAGAAIGSVIPGVGTAIGGAVGGIAGGIAGSSLGKKTGTWIQKELPGMKKSVAGAFSSFGKWAGKQWQGIGKFFGGIGSWFKGVGKGFNQKLIKPVAGAFKSAIKTAKGFTKAVGNAIATPFYFAVGLVHRYLVKPLQKPVTAALNWVSKKWKAFSKTAGKIWKSVGNAIKKPFVKGLNAVKKVGGAVGSWLGKKWKSFSTVAGKVWTVVGRAVKRPVTASIKAVKSVWSEATKWLGKKWNGLTKAAGEIFSAVADAISKPIKAAWDYISGIFDKIGSAVGKVGDKIGKTFSGVKDWASGVVKEGKSVVGHANGGTISSQHTALVGEGGAELAYTLNGRKARVLGANGPEFARVKPGERILNARDTHKVLNGRLGHVLPGYAAGTAKLGAQQSTKSLDKLGKQSKSDWSKTQKDTSKSTKKIKKTTVADYDDLQKGSVKQLNQLVTGNASKWKSIGSQTGKRTNKLRKDTVNDFDSMQKGTQKQMNQLESGVVASAKDTAVGFGKQMNRMKGYAHTAMGGAVGQLNHGITGIDTVLGQFGGNSSVIKPIKYAAGSNGAIAENQIAMVNDANYGPRQEAIQRGNHFILPKGNNRILPLQKGDRVLNGRQTEMLGLNRYAKGSGVSDSSLKKLIDANAKAPAKAFNNDFTVKVKVDGTDLQKGATSLSRNSSDRYGKPWYKEVWNQMSNAMSADDGASINGAALLKAVYKYGHGKPYVWGATGPSSFDCSGLVQYALKQAFGINYPRTSGAQIAYAHRISAGEAKPGDLVGNSGHIGVYMGGGKYYSAQSPNNHPNIGVSEVKYFPHGAHYFGRVSDKAIASSNNSKKSTSGKLSKLVKSEIGSQLKWVGKNLADDFGDFGGLSSGGNAITKAMIAQAEKVMKVPENIRGKVASDIMRMAISESGNRNIGQTISDVNSAAGNPAGGPLQYVKSTFMNYAVPGHKNWNSPYDQVLAFLNNSQYKTATGMTTIWGHRKFDWLGSGPHGSRRFANGGWAAKNALNIFGEVPGEPEVAINPARSTADNLIGQTIQARAKAEPSSPSADFLSTVKSAKVPSTKQSIKPQITININGDISDERMLKKTQDMIERTLAKSFKQIDDEYGLDESIY